MESLIISILGDIITFDNGEIYINRQQITKKKYGESFIEKGELYSSNLYYYFIYLGSVNRDLKKSKYSINTMLIFATLKGLVSNNDNLESIKDEYYKIYKKCKESNMKNLIPFEYLNSFSKLDNPNYKPNYNILDNDSYVLPRVIPIGLLYWKKDKGNREKLVKYTIQNVLLTHNNIKCYLSAVTLSLFLSYGRNNISTLKWANNLVDYLLSKEFDDIIKSLDLYNDTFIIQKEQYITIWNEYIGLYLKKIINRKNDLEFVHQILPYIRTKYLFNLSDNSDIYAYGLRGDDCILIAYDSLIHSTESWEKILLMGTVGPTNNSVMGTICGALFGAIYKFESIWIDKHLKEEWVKKTIKLGKSLGL